MSFRRLTGKQRDATSKRRLRLSAQALHCDSSSSEMAAGKNSNGDWAAEIKQPISFKMYSASPWNKRPAVRHGCLIALNRFHDPNNPYARLLGSYAAHRSPVVFPLGAHHR